MSSEITRREFIGGAGVALAALASRGWAAEAAAPLAEFGYSDVVMQSELHLRQFEETRAVLMGLEDDALLKPFRQLVGMPAPGEDLGGWYRYDADYNANYVSDGFAPSATFGQWISALARGYAIRPDPKVREKVIRLNRLYAGTISPEYYSLKNRFPAYCYDKLVCGLIDSHQYLGDREAFKILELTTNTALPNLPGHAVEHDHPWRSITDPGYNWDESYTISENLFLAYQRGAGQHYRALGAQYLDDAYYDPLARGESDLAGRHAYSYVNSLCSAMQAYLTLGSEKHLRAASNGFDFLRAQSFATGGWGPDEALQAPDSDNLYASLSKTHSSFETPCGSYAHFKLTRYLLRVTRDSRYGDSMERVMYNTILGAKPLQPDGRTFYYSDYTFDGSKFYKHDHWPCCSGTMPQIAADYWISTYFRDAEGVYVNLFVPSTLRWKQHGTSVSLTQTGEYRFTSDIQFVVETARPVRFDLRLRIPEWAKSANVAVNGKSSSEAVGGQFHSIRREWRNGDRVELSIPLANRLEAIDSRHSDTAALLCGPLVLFGIADVPPRITKSQLLKATKDGERSWVAKTGAGPLRLLPWTEIAEQKYRTYFVTS
jgi:hypothetical protein